MADVPADLVLVTGAAGFIGSNVVAALAENGKSIVVCDRFAQDDRWRYLAPYVIRDIVEPEHLLTWLKANGDEVSAIVHMGAISATTETDVTKIVRDNIRATIDLWEYAALADTAFVYASSAATYGDGTAGFNDDDSPSGLAALSPLNLYAWSKHFVDRRIADDVVTGRPTPTKWAGLKFFNVYGPNEGHKGPMRSLVHQLYPAAARGEMVRLFKSDNPNYPDGGQLRDFVYVKDCCRVIANILARPSVNGIFNAGTGVARTFEDLAKAVFRAVGQEPRIEYVDMPESLLGRYQYFTQANVSKLASADIAPDFLSLEDGVAEYVNLYLSRELAASVRRDGAVSVG